jgi:pyruvate kinase
MPSRFTAPALERMIEILSSVRDRCLETESSFHQTTKKVSGDYRASARNLLHYLALRQQDLRDFQQELSSYGLSSLGRMEANTLAGLDAVLADLHKMGGRNVERTRKTTPPVDFQTGPALLSAHTNALLGPVPKGRNVRIMVTMPSEAATEYTLVRDLLKAGMDVMRINCAHDDVRAWRSMVKNLRRAEKEVRCRCRVIMDLAGPKLRTGQIAQVHHILHWKPTRDATGTVIAPARIWLSSSAQPDPPSGEYVVLPVGEDLVKNSRKGDVILVKDARGKTRKIHVVRRAKGAIAAESVQSAYVEQGSPIQLRRAGHKLLESRVGNFPAVETPIVLRIGDRLTLTEEDQPGAPARFSASGELIEAAHIPCTLPEVFADIHPGERISFDDGKMEGVVKRASDKQVEVAMTAAAHDGSKLHSDKGINLPDSDVHLPALTAKDLADLSFAVTQADMIGLSFVRKPEDVRQLAKRMSELGAAGVGIVLKIENRTAFEHLPEILLAGLQSPPLGVMVARGDLAVEIGFERLAEVQEEMLWLCEAAHVPVVWATQVLENMAQTGKPSRAEVTDAAMSGRAECVMLNKGPHVIEAVRFLDNVLERMQLHQQKKRSMLRRLSVSEIGPASSVKRKTAGAA